MAPRKLLTSRAIIAEFWMRLAQGANGWAQRLSMKIDSSQAGEDYAWLGTSPMMREWVGGRLAKDLPEYSFRINNKMHEATLEVNIDDIRRDFSGQIMRRVAELADRVNAYPAKLISRLIQDGESQVCYDGQYFFDTDHVEGASGTQSNKITVDLSDLPVAHHGTVTDPSAAEMAKAILKGAQQMFGFKDDQGEPINENLTTFDVMVPINLWTPAVEAVKLPMVDSGNSNAIPASSLNFNVVANPRLTWTDKFSIFGEGESAPFILQEELPLEISAVAEGSELEFEERKHRHGVAWGGNVGYGLWQRAVQVNLTA